MWKTNTDLSTYTRSLLDAFFGALGKPAEAKTA